MSDEKKKVIVFRYDDELFKFQKLELKENINLLELLDSNIILLFVDLIRYRIWIWYGSNTTTRMKFLAAKLAPSIRDKYGIGLKLFAVDEGNESLGFKLIIGEEEELNDVRKQTVPIYDGFVEDLELSESLSKEKYPKRKTVKVLLPDEWDKIKKRLQYIEQYKTSFFKLLKKAKKKIEFIFKEQNVNQITIHRQYLPEIFNINLLKISDQDGLPTLKSLLLQYFWMKGFISKFYGNVVQFTNVKIEDLISHMRREASISEFESIELEKESETESVPILKTSKKLPPIPKEGIELKGVPERELERSIVQFIEKFPSLLVKGEKDIDPKWKYFIDYYMKKLYDKLKENMNDVWKIEARMQYVRHMFNEIYRKPGDLTQKEEEAVEFYKKFLKSSPKKPDENWWVIIYFLIFFIIVLSIFLGMLFTL